MSLIIVGIDNSRNKKYYTIDTNDEKLHIYSLQELVVAYNESDKDGNFRFNKKFNKIIKRGYTKTGLNTCEIENDHIVNGGIFTLINTKVDQNGEFIHRVYDLSSRSYIEISNEKLIDIIRENKINNDEWRKVGETEEYKDYILLIRIDNSEEKIESSIHQYVYADDSFKVQIGSSGKTDTEYDETDDVSVETLEKLLQSDEPNKIGSNSTDIKPINTGDSNETDEANFDSYRKIIYNMYPNDRITVSSKVMSNLNFRILRIIDSSLDGAEKIAIVRIDKTHLKSVFMLAKMDDKNQICTLQAIGHTDIPEKAMDGDIEKFCITYNKWLQMTRYF